MSDLATVVSLLTEIRDRLPALVVPAGLPSAATVQPPGLRAEDGWTPWGGGACPCRDWPEVEYVCRNGYRGTRRPENLTWINRDYIAHGDIIAYRRPR